MDRDNPTHYAADTTSEQDPLRATRPSAAVTSLVGIGETDSSVARSISLVESVFLPSLGKLAQAGHLARLTDADRALRVWVADVREGIV